MTLTRSLPGHAGSARAVRFTRNETEQTMTFSLLLVLLVAAAADHVVFDKREQLHERVLLEWKLSGAKDQRRADFRITATGAGWIGLGVSPNGGMPGSDITMAWLDAEDGKARVTDRHAVAKALPAIDADQTQLDVHHLTKTAAGALQLQFSRPVAGCGPDDRTLEGTARIIWALGDQPAADAEPSGHTLRGTRSIVLERADLGANTIGTLPGVETLDVRFQNTTTSGGRTRYWWRGFQVPADLVDTTVHIVGFEPIIDGELDVAHHMLMHFCPFADEVVDAALSYVGSHVDARAQMLFGACRSAPLVATWAVGGHGVQFPPEFGLPLGGHPSRRFLFLDLHLDVADERTHVTNIGFRLFFVRQKRPNDAAFLALGVLSSPTSLIVPPRTTASQRSGTCFADCLTAGLPAGGINVHATFLHMHTTGTAIRTRHILASGTEAPPLGEDDAYDFDLQDIRVFDDKRKLSRGDQLVTTCTYDTSKRAGPTVGGENTSDEMCLNFLLVWPAPAVTACQSGTAAEAFLQLFLSGAFGAVAPPAIDMTNPDPSANVRAITAFLSNTVKDWSKFDAAWAQLESGPAPAFQPLCLAPTGTPGGTPVPGMPLTLLTPTTSRTAIKLAPRQPKCGAPLLNTSTVGSTHADAATTIAVSLACLAAALLAI
jgi:hypothetical protein